MRSLSKISVAAIVFFIACSARAVLADPAYTADAIVRYFATKGRAPVGRSICIGSPEECGAPQSAGQSFDLQVTFDLGSDRLSPTAKRNLDEFAHALGVSALASYRFAVDGHTDARGGDYYNLELSRRRAQAVVRYLTSRGVDSAKLEAHGYGKSRPRTADPFDAANRRVETRLAD